MSAVAYFVEKSFWIGRLDVHLLFKILLISLSISRLWDHFPISFSSKLNIKFISYIKIHFVFGSLLIPFRTSCYHHGWCRPTGPYLLISWRYVVWPHVLWARVLDIQHCPLTYHQQRQTETIIQMKTSRTHKQQRRRINRTKKIKIKR